MSVITSLCWLVGFSLLVAASLKARNFREFSADLRSYDAIPLMGSAKREISALVAGVIVGAEALTFPLMLFPGTFTVGCLLAAILLLSFTAITGWQLSQGTKEISCACFGRSSRPLSWVVPIRSLTMSVPAVLALVVRDKAELSGAGFITAALVAALVSLLLEILQTRVTIDRTIISDPRGQV